MNSTEIELCLRQLDRVVLTGLARQALNHQTAEVVDWHYQANHLGRGSATGGVYRITGIAQNQGNPLPWSIMLKILSPAAHGNVPAETHDMAHPLYWKREALVYQSGLLNDLPPGLLAPRCFAAVEHPEDTIWLWMEEVKEGAGPCWPLAQYERAAQCLASFNAIYLMQPMPSYPWLCRNGSPRGVLDYFAGIQEVIKNPATWDHPLIRMAFPIPVADRLLQLWADRHVLLDAFEQLPHTLCHHDAWRKNMFAPHGLAGPIVVIDWAYLGRGVLATDAGDLMGASFGMFGVEPCTPSALDSAIFDNYLQGLHDAGWQGDRRAVRFAYATFTALKYAGLLFELRDLFDEGKYRLWEAISGHPMDELLSNKATLTYFLLDLADEARHLMQSL